VISGQKYNERCEHDSRSDWTEQNVIAEMSLIPLNSHGLVPGMFAVRRCERHRLTASAHVHANEYKCAQTRELMLEYLPFILLSGFFGFLGMLGLVAVYVNLTHYLLIKNTPTQTIRSVPQGFCELAGRAEPIDTVRTPLSKIDAVAYSLKVYYYTNSRNGDSRKTVLEFTCAPRFMLRDESGGIVVDAPRDYVLFQLMPYEHEKRYLVKRSDHSAEGLSWSEIIRGLRTLDSEYRRELRSFRKGGEYHLVRERIVSIADRLGETLSSFEPPIERVGFSKVADTLYATERAILPGDELLVIGTVSSKGGSRIIGWGRERVFTIANGDESAVLRSFRGILSFAIALIIVGFGAVVWLLLSLRMGWTI
jgi:hypothetical protein